ncbi:MAG: glycosyltransferase, partial [Saprospiraceae bacterium]|nr:glycosyltransferase [Saprospiraceae bacterium]
KRECLARGFDEEVLAVIPNGVDQDIPFHEDEVDQSSIERFEKIMEDYDNIVVGIGRPVKRKGFGWFIENVLADLPKRTAFVLVSPYKPPGLFRNVIFELLPKSLRYEIDLFLGFPTDQALLDSIDEYGNYPFHWFKNKDFQTLQYIVRNSDLMVMPNIKEDGDAEGFGLVALEASVMSKVVMASYMDGIPDAIHHERNGYLLPASNPVIWSIVIHSYFEMEDADRRKLEQTFHNYTIETFSWSRMVDNYYDLFMELTKSGKGDNELISRAS